MNSISCWVPFSEMTLAASINHSSCTCMQLTSFIRLPETLSQPGVWSWAAMVESRTLVVLKPFSTRQGEFYNHIVSCPEENWRGSRSCWDPLFSVFFFSPKGKVSEQWVRQYLSWHSWHSWLSTQFNRLYAICLYSAQQSLVFKNVIVGYDVVL